MSRLFDALFVDPLTKPMVDSVAFVADAAVRERALSVLARDDDRLGLVRESAQVQADIIGATFGIGDDRIRPKAVAWSDPDWSSFDVPTFKRRVRQSVPTPTLAEAIEGETPIAVRYTDARGKTTERDILPQRVEGDTLTALDLAKHEHRSFKVDSLDIVSVAVH